MKVWWSRLAAFELFLLSYMAAQSIPTLHLVIAALVCFGLAAAQEIFGDT